MSTHLKLETAKMELAMEKVLKLDPSGRVILQTAVRVVYGGDAPAKNTPVENAPAENATASSAKSNAKADAESEDFMATIDKIVKTSASQTSSKPNPTPHGTPKTPTRFAPPSAPSTGKKRPVQAVSDSGEDDEDDEDLPTVMRLLFPKTNKPSPASKAGGGQGSKPTRRG